MLTGGVFFSRADWLCAEVGVPCLCFAVSRVTSFGLCAKSNLNYQSSFKLNELAKGICVWRRSRDCEPVKVLRSETSMVEGLFNVSNAQ